MEEFNYEVVGKSSIINVEGDALSRLPLEVNALTNDSGTAHSPDENNSDLIPCTEAPLDVFKRQLIFFEGKVVTGHEQPYSNFGGYYIRLNRIDKESPKRDRQGEP